ncbi:MAG: hypothetical protein FWE54_06915 [Methanimicrococcus sp.]|nr:hypothetical protein [Methanimicrococcus sp.]
MKSMTAITVICILLICTLLLCGTGCISADNTNDDNTNADNTNADNTNADNTNADNTNADNTENENQNNNSNEIRTVFVPIPESPASYPYYTYEELTEKSDLVVMGHFVSFDKARWSTPDGKMPSGSKVTTIIDEDGNEYYEVRLNIVDEVIYTDSAFLIDEHIKGKTDSDTIIVRFFSGEVEISSARGKGLNAKDYEVDEPVILYLEHQKNGDESYYTILTPRGALFVDGNILTNVYDEKTTLESVKSYANG